MTLEKLAEILHIGDPHGLRHLGDREIAGFEFFTAAPFADRDVADLCTAEPAEDTKEQLRQLAKEKGMDFFGVASARTIDEISDQLSAIRKDETRFVVEDKNLRMEAFDPGGGQHLCGQYHLCALP